eukprot:1227661-Prymnesium_polylepis.1
MASSFAVAMMIHSRFCPTVRCTMVVCPPVADLSSCGEASDRASRRQPSVMDVFSKATRL